ncbi:MAG: phosphoribosylglycinamide formyltransferase [Azospirillaceae bacterium]
MARLNLGVLVSGRGSNLRALLDAAAAPDYPARVAVVISDTPGAGALDHAAVFDVPAVVIPRADHADRAGFEAAITDALEGHGVGLVCLAGFMRLVSADFCRHWGDRLINIHPSLLPAFRGLDTHVRALAAGVRIAGATVHVVRPAMDDGLILAQGAVPVADDDTPESLAARVLAVEHRLYPRVVAWIAEGRVRIEDERVRVDGAAPGACVGSGDSAGLLAPDGSFVV